MNYILKDISVDCYSSDVLNEKPTNDVKKILEWISFQRERTLMRVSKTEFSSLNNWIFDDGKLYHETRRFFSLEGIKVRTNYGNIKHWSQPIINQPEIGILGLIVKKIDGVFYLLIQSKSEPGNIGKVQLSPTVQATESNYKMVHGGTPTKYIEYFLNKNRNVLFNQLQSEQGTRFLNKKNRNIIIEIKENIEIYDNFYWMTINQLKDLIKYDNLINADLRSLMCNLNLVIYKLGNTSENNNFLNSLKKLDGYKNILEIENWIKKIKKKFKNEIIMAPLNELSEWTINDKEIIHNRSSFFSILPIDVKSNIREVKKWSQPILKTKTIDELVFFIKEIDGVYHFLVQASIEPGHMNRVELGPTLRKNINGEQKKEGKIKKIYDYYKSIPIENIIYSSNQSEEGGRFLYEEKINTICFVDDDFTMDLPEDFYWMTLGQIYYFLEKYAMINIEARSLLATLPII
jgi:oxidase EvaA